MKEKYLVIFNGLYDFILVQKFYLRIQNVTLFQFTLRTFQLNLALFNVL